MSCMGRAALRSDLHGPNTTLYRWCVKETIYSPMVHIWGGDVLLFVSNKYFVECISQWNPHVWWRKIIGGGCPLGASRDQTLENFIELLPRCLPLTCCTGCKAERAGTTLIFGGGVIYIWHAFSEVLAVAISCIAWVWCASRLYHVVRVSGHVSGGVFYFARVCCIQDDLRYNDSMIRVRMARC